MGLATGIGLGIQFNRGGGQSWESELVTYMNGLTTPLSTQEKTAINNLIKTLKTGLSITNLSDAFDVFVIDGGETSEVSLKNLAKNAHHGTAVGGLTFSAGLGFTGGATTKYINSNYNINDDKVAVLENNISFGFYTITEINSTSTAYVEMGSSNGTSVFSQVVIRTTTNLIGAPLNGVGGANPTNNDSTPGMFIITRNGDNNVLCYKNKVSLGTRVQTSSGMPDCNVYVLVRNDAGTITYFTKKQASVHFIGRGFNETEVGVITDAIVAYRAESNAGKPNGTKYFALTFDAGYTNHYTDVYPYLAAKGIKYTEFITSDLVGDVGRMTWAQLLELHNLGVDIQCHSKTHTDFTTLSEAQVKAELDAVDAAFIANGLPAPRHHGYPAGAYNDNVKTWVATRRDTAMRINTAAGVEEFKGFGSNIDKFIVPRVAIQNADVTNYGMPAIKTNLSNAMNNLPGRCWGSLYAHGFDSVDVEQIDADDFDEIITYLISLGVEFVTMSELYALMD
jgi:peptidoglycan/xylan/chitin deacetylase (PgdA/CDA1 family)